MAKPKVSIVLTARNEYPIVLTTLMSFYEELVYWGYPFEIILVDNMSTDLTPEVVEDRFRRWVRAGFLKVIRYNERPGNVLVRNIGAEAATGDVVVLADSHLSITRGCIHALVDNWRKVGGLWHPAMHVWGDTSDIRCYGYRLKLKEKFWGDLSRGLPDTAKHPPEALISPPEGLEDKWASATAFPHRVPMASHCCLLAGREEYLDLGGYHPDFRCYGGGEPYLDLLYWLTGREVWLEPRALVRHATFSQASWKKIGKSHQGAPIWVKGRGLTKTAEAGEEQLRYHRGYGWTNEDVHHNFMLSAYVIGGYEWLQHMYKIYWEKRQGNPRYVADLKTLRRDVLREGAERRRWLAERQVCTLDQLLDRKPWAA